MEFKENLTIEEWTNNNELAINIFNKKYKYGDETFMDTINRIAGGNDIIKKLILEKKFLPGGRICANRGLDKFGKKVSLSNCYVMPPVEDNLSSIFDTAKDLAITFSRGGGCGLDISKLAFKGAKVRNAAEASTGAVSFMDLYSNITGLISQNGRRGALMISMDVNHPDIEEFIDVKQDLDKVTKANISVKVSDAFMKAVKEDGDFTLRFTREETGETKCKVIKARDLFRKIAQNNYDMGEPGVLFWNTFNKWNILSEDPNYTYAGVNPCAEQSLPAYGACLLGAINLSEFVKNPFEDNSYFDYDEFSTTVRSCVDELNTILDEGLPLHPLKKQSETAKNWRQIGLGIMGLADMLIKMGIKYGSKAAIDLCDHIGKIMFDNAAKESSNLARIHGSYPNYNSTAVLSSRFIKYNTSIIDTYSDIKKYGLRNSHLLTIAPTGSLSNLLGISGGIEPIFANSYTRKTETLNGEDTYYKVYTPIVQEYMGKFGIIDEKDLPDYFVTSHDIPYEDRINMQAVWQKHIDVSISSTINLPESATVEDIEDIYMKAWENGLKGITVFRDNCKRTGILTTTDKKEKTEDLDDTVLECIDSETLKRGEVISVDNNAKGLKRKLITGCGSLHCIALFDPETGDLVETYLAKGSTGGCNNFMVGLSRMISVAARGGVSIHDIIDQLKSTGACPSYATRKATNGDTSQGACCPMAVGNALLDMYNEFNHLGKYSNGIEEKKEVTINNTIISTKESATLKIDDSMLCPLCHSKLERIGGCYQCNNCGWSKCD